MYHVCELNDKINEWLKVRGNQRSQNKHSIDEDRHKTTAKVSVSVINWSLEIKIMMRVMPSGQQIYIMWAKTEMTIGKEAQF